MKIKEIKSTYRNDFTATMECEHCSKTILNEYGYNDSNYHQNVIPAMYCKFCGLNRDGEENPVRTHFKALGEA